MKIIKRNLITLFGFFVVVKAGESPGDSPGASPTKFCGGCETDGNRLEYECLYVNFPGHSDNSCTCGSGSACGGVGGCCPWESYKCCPLGYEGKITCTGSSSGGPPYPVVKCLCFSRDGSGETADCLDAGSCCKGINENRRRLETANPITYKGDEAELRRYFEACNDFDYEGFLYIDEHVYAIASPGKQAQDAKCPFLAAQTVFDSNHNAQKEVLVWHDQEAFESRFEGALQVGTFRLQDIIYALDLTDPSGSYEVFTNNCAYVAMSIASTLGVQVDMRMTAYVASRLAKHTTSRTLASTIRESVHYITSASAGRRLDAVSDETLIEIFVNDSVADLM